jgi:type I restriction enzyme R subunit
MRTDSQFTFLTAEWPEIHEAAAKAESLVHSDARASCFYARRSLELTVAWLYTFEKKLRLPYQDHLAALIHEPTFRATVGGAVFNKAKILKELGNQAVHSQKKISTEDALMAVKELFHIGFWLARTYAKASKPADSLTFDSSLVPTAGALPPHTLAQLQKLDAQLKEKDTKLTELLSDKATLDEELQRLRAEVAAAKKANTAQPDNHDYSEAQTRDYFIDLLLKEAGWALDQPQDREYEVSGMPNSKEKGFVDYVLWGDDGLPLGLNEAKRTKRDPRVGQQQAKLYADCLEKQFGQRPVIFFSNGYEHWIWDDVNYPPRPIQGFLKKAELELMIQRRKTRKPLATAEINLEIAGRYYQTRCIRRIGETFEIDYDRKALVVMATGGGKTRVVIALSDLLMRCNWAKRVLFLADRVALVKQAVKEFKKYLPEAPPVNLVTDKNAEGRIFVSTYPTMMGLIDETKGSERRFGVGHFDLIIIDEAHRSVYQKYRAIFDYFDSLLVGLTATPRDEIDRDTYGLFDLERGVPTDAYDLQDAVDDKFLVPAVPVSVPLRFQREGIKYNDLSDEEKEEWDAKEWNDDGTVPDVVEAEAVNKWLFNIDTVDKVLAHLMTRGVKVAGGDRLGKTIIFAKNQKHADFIADRFNVNYPHYKGAFARVITFKTEYAQTLIDDFSKKDGMPHIAISVDMLDTGIDVPEVVNLVFFKLVRSKTKFWQMIGRGTRLCPDLFGPGMHKKFFQVFDYCQNLEYFSQNPDAVEGALAPSLTKRIFIRRLELVTTLDQQFAAKSWVAEGTGLMELRDEAAKYLRDEVAAMNVENFVVRPQRRLVEKYAAADAWKILPPEATGELVHQVAGLPSEIETDDEEAKRFDLLMLNLQLAQLNAEPGFMRLRDQVIAIAGLLEEQASIPMIQQKLALIQHVQTDEWWQDVTIPMLESLRRNLRLLIKLIEKKERKIVYTDFEDELGDEIAIELPGMSASGGFEKFRAKARQFLKSHEDHIAIHKLRTNEALTPSDITELERMLAESGVGSPDDIEKAKIESNGLGLFVRSLVGMDRGAAKKALGVFLASGNLKANQIEFLDEIVNHLTEHGCLETERLYESPYIDFSPQGVDGVFAPSQVDQLVAILEEVRHRAVI